MKNLLICVCIFVAFTMTQAFAYNAREFSNDTKIITALNLLYQNGEYSVFENMKKNGVKVKFYNLSMSNIYAANSYDNYGQRVILINSYYKDAPIEQIACLIAHESYHTARTATLEEETLATQKEAECWTKLKRTSTTYPETKLTKRLNKLAGLYLASSDGSQIRDKIASSNFYRTQFGI